MKTADLLQSLSDENAEKTPMSEPDCRARAVIPEHLMLSRLAQSEQMREFFIQMWIQNPVLAGQGRAMVKNLLSPLESTHAMILPGAQGSDAHDQQKMIKNTMQKGFSLVTAIFLLVVLSALGAAMMTFFTAQQQSSALDVLGSRAYHAARAGIDWGAYQVLRNGGGCAAAAQTLPAGTFGGTLGAFEVTVGCSSSAHSEVSAPGGSLTVYRITATASRGAAGQPDFVERQIEATIGQ